MKFKYSDNFERDWSWYNKYKDIFNFCGAFIPKFEYQVNGYTAKECFHKFDSSGVKLPCKELNLLDKILVCKGSINLNIKEWAIDRASFILPRILFKEIIEEFELLDWMIDSVERQSLKIRKNKICKND